MAANCYEVTLENKPPEDEDQLVIARFPAMASQFSQNSANQIHLSYKPKSMRFKLEVSLESKSRNFCPQQALALGAKAAPKSFPSMDNRVDRNTYASSKTPVEDGQLFVCKLINNKLVCRPVSHLLAFRSDFSHFDLKDEIDPKEEVRPVSVKFAAPERQQHNAPPKSSNPDNQQEQDDSIDEFQPLQFKRANSLDAQQQRTMLFGMPLPKVKPDPDEVTTDQKPVCMEYLPDIKPKIEKMDVDDIYSNSESMLLHSSPKKVNLIKQRVKDCLLKAKLVSFEEVYHFIKSNDNSSENVQLNNKDILDSLGEMALLVQGNWAVKSEILYGDSSERDCTDVTGISINLFISARDYLLWLFTQNRFVSRIEYSKKVRMPDHDVLQLFNQLAQFRRETKNWELKLATDSRFLKQFPDVVQRQAAIWKVRKANKLSIFT